MLDNGRIRFRDYKEAIICELYSNDKICIEDINWSLSVVQTKYTPPVKVIAIKSGNYWISTEAQMRMFQGFIEIAKLSIVVTKAEDIRHAKSAEFSFLANMDISITNSVEEAYKKLTS